MKNIYDLCLDSIGGTQNCIDVFYCFYTESTVMYVYIGFRFTIGSREPAFT